MRIPNNKNFETQQTHEPQLWPRADKCKFGRSTALNYPITTVQYLSVLDGHMVGMMRCGWLFTIGYIIIPHIDPI